MKTPWSYPADKKRPGPPKRPPEPKVNTMPAVPVACRCGRLWANAVTKDAHVWKEHNGIEPSEEEHKRCPCE